jgi:hypothetical protein
LNLELWNSEGARRRLFTLRFKTVNESHDAPMNPLIWGSYFNLLLQSRRAFHHHVLSRGIPEANCWCNAIIQWGAAGIAYWKGIACILPADLRAAATGASHRTIKAFTLTGTRGCPRRRRVVPPSSSSLNSSVS